MFTEQLRNLKLPLLFRSLKELFAVFICDVSICILDRVVDSLSVPEMETMHVDENFKGYFIIKYQ